MIGIVIILLGFVISCSDSEGEGNDLEIINKDINESEDEIVVT